MVTEEQRRLWRENKAKNPQVFSDEARARRNATKKAWDEAHPGVKSKQSRESYLRRKLRCDSDPELAQKLKEIRLLLLEKRLSDPIKKENHLRRSNELKRLRRIKNPPKPETAARKAYVIRWVKNRIATNAHFRIAHLIRCRIRSVLNGISKAEKSMVLLGCSIPFFINYIESKWEDGMSWSNYGNRLGCWTFDHIKPCAAFDLENGIEQKLCFHYSNVRPCWHRENSAKSSFWNGKKYTYNRIKIEQKL